MKKKIDAYRKLFLLGIFCVEEGILLEKNGGSITERSVEQDADKPSEKKKHKNQASISAFFFNS